MAFFICLFFFFFFFNDTATTEIYTLSLHDALPISRRGCGRGGRKRCGGRSPGPGPCPSSWWRNKAGDRKSTRLNSSHGYISYAVFCLKKKKKNKIKYVRINMNKQHREPDTQHDDRQ